MSRFFVSGYSSGSSSEEEDLLSSEEEALVSSSEEESSDFGFENDDSDDDSSDSDDDAPKGPSYFLKSNFMKGGKGSDSDSDDEDRKVVKSAKEKLLDDLKDSIEKLNVAKRVNNWANVLSEFDRLGKLLVRAQQQSIGTPNFYIKALADLQDFADEATTNEKEAKKKMNADQSRAFNTLKQRVKKQIKEFQYLVELYRQDPEAFEKEEALETAQANKEDDVAGFTPVGASRTLPPVFQTLKQISESRGKKNIDKYEQIQILENLMDEFKANATLFELISMYQMLLSVRFDASSNQAFMPLDQWTKNLKDIELFLQLLSENSSQYEISELGRSTDDIDIEPTANENGVKVIFGSVSSLVERLSDEFTRYLQNTDPHSTEYVERLKDESAVYSLIVKCQLYVESTTPEAVRQSPEGDQLSRIISRRLDHIYYKPNQLIKANETAAWKDIDASTDSSIVSRNTEPVDLIVGLVDFLSKQTTGLYAKKGLLGKIYYFAVNNQYSTARELFLSSQVYANIHTADSSLQVMYNRALVQLGLSAFRAGLIEESHQTLNEIANSQRLKELLGQGFNTKYPSQATVSEKQKLLPFHMHTNLELLECVFMTSSLLIEIPALAAASNSTRDSKRKVHVKSFKSKLEFHERQYFTGPPESIKDHIIHASRALQKGNWLKAYDLLSSIKIWKLFPDNEQLLAMMKNQLQVEGLRTYIFTYKSIYSKLSIDVLASNFKLDGDVVLNILDKMVQSGDIAGSIDENKKFISFESSEPQRTRLQELAIIMNEKVGLLTEKNEKTASNGHSRKNAQQQNQQAQQQAQQQSQAHREHNDDFSKFRYANVNSNNDEFQSTS